MRRCVLIVALSLLAVPPAAAQQGEACSGALWGKVKAWLKPAKTFDETITFLRSEAIDYAVFDARTAPAAADGEVQVSTDHVGATDCQPRKEAPQCSVVLSEPRADSKAAASPTTVESDEIISIDFDAKGKQTGHSCEVVQTGL